MAHFRCQAPSCGSFGSLCGDVQKIMAVHPELCEYREILLCSGCAMEAIRLGVRTVGLMEAREIIRRRELDREREEFFLQFVPAPEESQAMSA